MSGILRAPRCLVNGIAPLDCAVHVHAHQSANTFSAKLALDVAGTFDGATQMQAEILASNSGPASTPMFMGVVDKVAIDWHLRIVYLSGRDMTAGPLDKKTNQKWLNQSPQQIIQSLAGMSGLGVQFLGGQGGSSQAGRQFNQDYNRISELDSHWNIIVKCAKEIGCIAYVNGNTIVIAPWNMSTGGVYPVTYTPSIPPQSNAMRLTTTSNLQLSNVSVNVKSWQHKQGQAIEANAGNQGIGVVGGGASNGVQHDLKQANLTQEQAQQLAQSRLSEIQSHQRTIEVELPGDVTINPQMMLALSGTGTSADMSYIISDIEHRWSWSQGYIMVVRGRNQNGGGGAGGGGA